MLPERVVHELLALNALKALRPARLERLHRPLYRLELKARPVAPLMAAFREVLECPLEAG